MQFTLAILSLLVVHASALVQDPCAGCTEEHALKYQKCARDFGDACTEVTTVTQHKLDYLGERLCKGKKKDDEKCPEFDVNSGKECPTPWKGEKDWKTNEDWDCEIDYEMETVTIAAGGQGKKKDVSCCMAKTKHENCLKCKAMDCSHGTCADHVNKKYYSERTLDEPPLDAEAAKKEAGWGL